ncbi:MAG: glycerate kinase [Clostridia bacterium]|nr:glycerate kinase [Clostridia bacterium]
MSGKRILIAPDSFKGTLTAAQVADLIAEGLLAADPTLEITRLPVADGGEGLAEALRTCCGGTACSATVSGVFGTPMQAGYLLLPDGTAVIETAACAGLPLAGEKKNPALATTRGVGELMLDAARSGAKRILLGLGGSATNDGGIGAASALGWQFLNAAGDPVEPVGAHLADIRKILPPATPFPLPVEAACDVENPFFGPQGAAYVFAPQKGADPAMVAQLDAGLRQLAAVIAADCGSDVAAMPGAGAAGGFGGGAVAFFGATLKKGIDLVLDAAGFDALAAQADWIITGEGRLDSQSADGKVISGVAKRGAAAGKPVLAICGCKGDGWERILGCGVTAACFSTETPKPMAELLRTCRSDLTAAAKRAAETILHAPDQNG